MKNCRALRMALSILPIVLLAFLSAFADAQRSSPSPEEDLFFSMRRVVLRPEIAIRLSSRAESRAQKDIARFVAYYGSGTEKYYDGYFTGASEDFIKARNRWPEYFYADFAAALSFEASGDHDEAARYYKSYLNKLNAYARGHYGISSPIIRSFSTGPIEEYDYAYSAVKRRMLYYGINLSSVRPAVSWGKIIPGLFLISGFLVLFLLVFYLFVPFVKKKVREKNPPEGFWICTSCGACVPELAFECSVCGRQRPENKDKEKDGGNNVKE